MKDSVEIDELPDGFGIFLKLEVDVSSLAGEGLGSFEDLLGDGGDESFVLLLVEFFDFGLEIVYF